LLSRNSVASVFLAEVDLPEAHRAGVVEHMVMVHQSVRTFSADFEAQLRRHNYVTPKNYLDFVGNYKSSLRANRVRLGELSARLDAGLQKLIQAADEVAQMQTSLAEAKIVVDAKSKQCAELLTVISTNTAEVESKQAVAQQKEAELSVESQQIGIEKAEAEQALEEAIPALEAAAEALTNLKKDEITEIRSFAKPHILVQKVCECVVILRGLKDISWKGAKAMMADARFLSSLIEFDKDGITEKQMKALKDYFRDPKLTIEELMSISTAGAGLLRWVCAMMNYNNIAKTVNPKRQAVAAAEKNLKAAMKELERIKVEVAGLNAQLAKLSEQFSASTAEAQELKAKADLMEKRLEAARRLIAGLDSERTRWTKEMEDLAATRERLLGDCLLSSSFLSYTGAFTFDFRKKMVQVRGPLGRLGSVFWARA
jgi:dynein heavy chain